MPFGVVGVSWQRRPIRVIAAVVVFVGAVFLENRLANFFLPVDVEKQYDFAPTKVPRRNAELVLETPIVRAVGSTSLLLSHEKNVNEVVDVYFDRAELTEKTIRRFQSLGVPVPSAPGPVAYVTNSTQVAPHAEECRTFARLRLEGIVNPTTAVHFYQLQGLGFDKDRSVEMKVSGAELLVDLHMAAPPSATAQPLGCQKLLEVGDWQKSIPGSLGVELTVPSNSSFRFHFMPAGDAAEPLGGTEGLYQPFVLGAPQVSPEDPPPLQVRAVLVKPLGNESIPACSKSLLSARSQDGKPPLTVENLKLGSAHLQIDVSGKGRVTVGCEPVTVNLLERATKDPLLGAVLAAANGGLLAWLVRIVFVKLQKPESSLETSSLQEGSKNL